MCITPEVKLCVGLRHQDRAMAKAQNPTHIKIVWDGQVDFRTNRKPDIVLSRNKS